MPIITKKLIEKEIQKPPVKGNRVVWDEATKGFGIVITAARSASFILNYYNVEGKQRRYTIGRFSEWDVDSARGEAVVLRKKIRGDAEHPPFDPLAQREQEQKKVEAQKLDQRTIAQLGQEYLERYAIPNKRAKSIREDKRIIENIILNPMYNLRDVPVSEPFKDLQRRLEESSDRCRGSDQ
jgi:hypothetical protein